MRRTLLAAIGAVILIAAASPAHARTVKMLFWYPGEAGSTLEAQPVLDAFFAYVNQKIAPDQIKGSYFNTIDGGTAYLKKEQPVVGIISYAAFTQERSALGTAKVVFATLPFPGGAATERYVLVGAASEIKPNAKLIASEPLQKGFVRAELFRTLPDSVAIVQTPQMFQNLKRIAEGQLEAFAILTPTEAASLARLSSPWAKALKVIAQSEAVPTARVVLFEQGWTGFEKLRNALLSAGSDPATQPVLEEMRLKGFAENK